MVRMVTCSLLVALLLATANAFVPSKPCSRAKSSLRVVPPVVISPVGIKKGAQGKKGVKKGVKKGAQGKTPMQGKKEPDPAKFSARMGKDTLCAWAEQTTMCKEDVDSLRESKYDGDKVVSSNLIKLQGAGLTFDGATRLMDEVTALSHGPAVHLVYSHMFGPNQKEESAIVLRTEAEFSDFAGGGTEARLWLMSRDPATDQRTKVDVKTLRAAAKAVADLRKDKNAYLWHRHPQDSVQGAVENLESNRQTTASGLEKQSNLAVLNSDFLLGALGPLKAVVDQPERGMSVQINQNVPVEAKGGTVIKKMNRIQLDGVFLNTKVVVINEAKYGLSEDKVRKCVAKKALFFYYLQEMIRSPEDFYTEPPEAKTQLVEAGLTAVRVVVSCYNPLTPEAEDACKIEGFFVCKPNGEGYSVAA